MKYPKPGGSIHKSTKGQGSTYWVSLDYISFGVSGDQDLLWLKADD